MLHVIHFFWPGRYAAPEVYKNEEYDTKVDVFSFALILQEVLPLALSPSQSPPTPSPYLIFPLSTRLQIIHGTVSNML